MLMGVFALLLAPQAMAGMLIGSTRDAIYDIDPATGVASNPRTLDSPAYAIEFVDGVLYGTSGAILSTIDVASGEAHTVGAMTGFDPLEGILDLSWNPQTDTLFALAHLGGTSLDRLYTIDTSSLAATLIGDLDQVEFTTVAFDASGALYAMSPVIGVLSLIDPTTAATLTSTNLPADIQPAKMVFADMNRPIVSAWIDDDAGFMFDLNLSDGTLSAIGRTGLDVSLTSLAYIPEPGSLVLLLVGLGGTGARRMRIMVNSIDRSGNLLCA